MDKRERIDNDVYIFGLGDLMNYRRGIDDEIVEFEVLIEYRGEYVQYIVDKQKYGVREQERCDNIYEYI